jgi:group I intron endonuclease
MIIYKITNIINNKIYIGQTTTDLKTRWRDHCRFKNRQMHPIKYAIQKYSKENFKIEQIDAASSLEELNKKEEYWISFYNSTDKSFGYNLMKGGYGKGRHSEETIKKMKNSHAGKPRKKHSEETKLAFSLSRKGKPAHNKGKKGKPHTKETKELFSKMRKGKAAHNRFKGKSGEMYAIKKKINRFYVTVCQKYLGCFKTIEEAQLVRDNYIKSILEKG